MTLKKKKKITLKHLHGYVRSRLGYSSSKYESIYSLVCQVLEKDGKPKPSHLSYKTWVKKNVDYLTEQCLSIAHKNWVKAQQKSVKPSVATNDFLQSYEWRRVRMIALKKYGARCQCCGATPATGAVMNVDHIKPRKLFPELALDPNNLQVLCGECNHGKGNWDMTDWRETSHS